jgi:hypothetical protein
LVLRNIVYICFEIQSEQTKNKPFMPNPENVVGKGNRFKKGQSGNPNGRPKELPALKELMKKIMSTEDKNGIQTAEQILEAVKKRALDGDIKAAELLLDRAYGKVVTPVATTDSEGKDIAQLNIIAPVGLKLEFPNNTDGADA